MSTGTLVIVRIICRPAAFSGASRPRTPICRAFACANAAESAALAQGMTDSPNSLGSLDRTAPSAFARGGATLHESSSHDSNCRLEALCNSQPAEPTYEQRDTRRSLRDSFAATG